MPMLKLLSESFETCRSLLKYLNLLQGALAVFEKLYCSTHVACYENFKRSVMMIEII